MKAKVIPFPKVAQQPRKPTAADFDHIDIGPVVTIWAELPPVDAEPVCDEWFNGSPPEQKKVPAPVPLDAMAEMFTEVEESWFEVGTSVDYAPREEGEYEDEPTAIRRLWSRLG